MCRQKIQKLTKDDIQFGCNPQIFFIINSVARKDKIPYKQLITLAWSASPCVLAHI